MHLARNETHDTMTTAATTASTRCVQRSDVAGSTYVPGTIRLVDSNVNFDGPQKVVPTPRPSNDASDPVCERLGDDSASLT